MAHVCGWALQSLGWSLLQVTCDVLYPKHTNIYDTTLHLSWTPILRLTMVAYFIWYAVHRKHSSCRSLAPTHELQTRGWSMQHITSCIHPTFIWWPSPYYKWYTVHTQQSCRSLASTYEFVSRLINMLYYMCTMFPHSSGNIVHNTCDMLYTPKIHVIALYHSWIPVSRLNITAYYMLYAVHTHWCMSQPCTIHEFHSLDKSWICITYPTYMLEYVLYPIINSSLSVDHYHIGYAVHTQHTCQNVNHS